MNGKLETDDAWDAHSLDPDRELTEREAEEYAFDAHDLHLPVSKLQRSRIGLCSGPKYLKIDGWGVRYTPRFIDEYVMSRRSHVVDPADLFVAL